jgi:hypothetical protein
MTDKEDISLEEMLGAPQLTKFSTATPGERRPSTAQHSVGEQEKPRFDDSSMDDLYIAEYPDSSTTGRKGSKSSTTSTAAQDLIPDKDRGEQC